MPFAFPLALGDFGINPPRPRARCFRNPTAERPLSEVVEGLPDIWQVERRVPCPWDNRAAVMSVLNDPARGRRQDSADVLVYGDVEAGERIVVVPANDRPVLAIYAESTQEQRTNELAAEWEDLVGAAQG